MTRRALSNADCQRIIEEFYRTVPKDALDTFVREHHKEISRQLTIILLLNPKLEETLGEERLMAATRLIVWINHHRPPDDDRRKPRGPKPSPLPSGGRILITA